MKNTMALLKEHGLKATKLRLALIAYLEEIKRPISLPKMAIHFRKIGNESSVYRSVQEFIRTGIVREVPIDQGTLYVEFTHSHDENHHHHIVCRKCKRIEELSDCTLDERLLPCLPKKTGFAKIDMHQLEFFGICKSCTLRKR